MRPIFTPTNHETLIRFLAFQIIKRMRLSLELVKKEMEVLILQRKLAGEVQEKIKSQSTQYMLREQLKLIKRELGIEKDDKDALAEKFRGMLKEKTVPKEVQAVIEEELKKLSFLENYSSEFT